MQASSCRRATAADARAMFLATHVRVHGRGGPAGLDRVLVVLVYETVEMDYFSPDAPGFLADLVDQYQARGISLAGIYSDEMHIQQDWSYHSHMDGGQFTVRYVSAGFQQAFARRFGAQYADFAKYLVYFASHQHEFSPDPRTETARPARLWTDAGRHPPHAAVAAQLL